MHKCCHGIIIINSKLSLKRCFKNSPIFSCSKVFFFSFHTQQRICCRAILPKILLTLEMPHYYHWFSVKNHNHLIHTMCGYIYNGILCISFVKVLSLLLGKSISQVNQSQSATTQQHQYVAG